MTYPEKMLYQWSRGILRIRHTYVGRDGVTSVATSNLADGSGFEPRWSRLCPHPYKEFLRPVQPPVQRETAPFPASKVAGNEVDYPLPPSAVSQDRITLHFSLCIFMVFYRVIFIFYIPRSKIPYFYVYDQDPLTESDKELKITIIQLNIIWNQHGKKSPLTHNALWCLNLSACCRLPLIRSISWTVDGLLVSQWRLCSVEFSNCSIYLLFLLRICWLLSSANSTAVKQILLHCSTKLNEANVHQFL